MTRVWFHYQSSFERPHPGLFIAMFVNVETYSFFESEMTARRADGLMA